MRALASLLSFMILALVAPAAALADDNAGGTSSASSAGSGGAEYGVTPPDPMRTTVPGTRAKRTEDGYAAAPADAPPEVQEAIWAANEIVKKPYRYGGGHRSFKDTGYDCSGTISYALNRGGWLKAPLDSGSFMRWRKKGKGSWVTVYTNPGHAYLVIAGLRLDTSSAGERRSSGKGPRWRSNARRQKGFKRRHPAGF